jgi:DNA polymerase III alpha subunit
MDTGSSLKLDLKQITSYNKSIMNIIKATQEDGIELLYRGHDIKCLPFEQTEQTEQFNKFCDLLEVEPIVTEIKYSKQFNIPQHYLNLDVEQYIKNLAPNDPDRLHRVEQELDLFRTRKLFPLLQLLIYIIDTMRKHNIIWGVGRGSSVASYCLYLIGVHKVDSVKYNLDIREFLK